ncbi:MAG: biotin/lipoyl-containing protein, partial [Pseudomonadota bacterium]
MSIEIRVPTLGESVTEATVAKWLKQPGETVAAEEPLLELETDKVSVEVPAPAAGALAEIVAKEGETVGLDALLGVFEAGDGAAAAAPPAAEKAEAPAASSANGAAGGEEIAIKVPTLGESVTEATVAKWFKKTGDAVAADETICELETDKVSVEVPAPAAGVINEIVAKEGETVGLDAVIATLAPGAAPAAPPKGEAAPKAEEKKAETPAPKPAGAAKSKTEVLAEAARGVPPPAAPVAATV